MPAPWRGHSQVKREMDRCQASAFPTTTSTSVQPAMSRGCKVPAWGFLSGGWLCLLPLPPQEQHLRQGFQGGSCCPPGSLVLSEEVGQIGRAGEGCQPHQASGTLLSWAPPRATRLLPNGKF